MSNQISQEVYEYYLFLDSIERQGIALHAICYTEKFSLTDDGGLSLIAKGLKHSLKRAFQIINAYAMKYEQAGKEELAQRVKDDFVSGASNLQFARACIHHGDFLLRERNKAIAKTIKGFSELPAGTDFSGRHISQFIHDILRNDTHEGISEILAKHPKARLRMTESPEGIKNLSQLLDIGTQSTLEHTLKELSSDPESIPNKDPLHKARMCWISHQLWRMSNSARTSFMGLTKRQNDRLKDAKEDALFTLSPPEITTCDEYHDTQGIKKFRVAMNPNELPVPDLTLIRV